jgi:hypothetical protein
MKPLPGAQIYLSALQPLFFSFLERVLTAKRSRTPVHLQLHFHVPPRTTFTGKAQARYRLATREVHRLQAPSRRRARNGARPRRVGGMRLNQDGGRGYLRTCGECFVAGLCPKPTAVMMGTQRRCPFYSPNVSVVSDSCSRN